MNEQKIIEEQLTAKKVKYEADKKDPKINKSVWNEEKRRWVHPFSQTGYIQLFVRSCFANMKTEN